jgi:hypothetical protein
VESNLTEGQLPMARTRDLHNGPLSQKQHSKI